MTNRFLFCESGEPHGLKKPEYFDTKSSNKKTSLKPFWQMTKRESSECCLSTVNKREGWEGTMRRRQSFATILVGKSILLREGLARILRSANFRILASVSCTDDLLASKLQQHQPLFIVVHTGDDFHAAVEQIEIFRDQHPGGRIAIVADHYRLSELVSAFRAGANGYFVDFMTCNAFIKSMELMMMGETIFPPAFLSFVIDPESGHLYEAVPGDESNKAILVTTEDALAPQLSSREKSVLRCLIIGDSNKCIARKMDIAEATVKVHVKAILRKIRVQNRTQAAIWGANNGSLTRTANNSSLPATSNVSKPLPKSVAVMSEIKQVEVRASTEGLMARHGRAGGQDLKVIKSR